MATEFVGFCLLPFPAYPLVLVVLVLCVPQKLVETYHGVYVTITYMLTCTLQRRGFSKSLTTELEFIVEVPVRQCVRTRRCDSTSLFALRHQSPEALPKEPVDFTISPESLENVRVVRYVVVGPRCGTQLQ